MNKVILDSDPGSFDIAKQLGITFEEYQHIVKHLERAPMFAELCVLSAMYSEHCSYKSSKPFLKRFPTQGKRVLQGPGENAGVVSINDEWAVAFKMESHNHPSFIEPYQGAATGVGGILRDIFTMGARPIASQNALCFGEYSVERKRKLVPGVVKGVGDYGNCVGVPMVSGQTFFHPCYNQNILVNAFTLGLLRQEEIYLGKAEGVGNWLVYVGAKTGKDGIHGASMASQEFSSEKELERPTVQVGDPFTEKLLLEATLEAMKAKLIIGIQDMGAAGLTSSSFEMAERAKTGLEIDLNKVPTREAGMKAFELLLSESQERMLLVTSEELYPKLKAVYEKWDLHSEIIGSVVEGNRVKMTFNEKVVVDLPVSLVTEPLFRNLPRIPPSDLKQRWFLDRNRILQSSLDKKFEALLADPNFANAAPLYQQYDSMVGNRTETPAYEKGAVLKLRDIKNQDLRLAVTVDGNPRVTYLSPREGGRRVIVESAINLALKGAEAIGVTDCLNYGSPENPEVLWQLEESIQGISEACEHLKIPVISGNVSLYNETDGKPIYPTPMIGMVGLIENYKNISQTPFFGTQLEIALLGQLEGGLGGSSFAYQWFQRDCGEPEATDLPLAARMISFLKEVQKQKYRLCLQDVSDGGLLLTLLEMGFRSPFNELGVQVHFNSGVDADRFLFGETAPRIVCAYEASDRTLLESAVTRFGIPFTVIGETDDSGSLKVFQGKAKVLDYSMPKLKESWDQKWAPFF